MEHCMHSNMAGCCDHYFHCCPMLALVIPLLILCIHIRVIQTVALWFIFRKADEPGWASIIPIYNLLIAIKVAGKPWWYILLLLISFIQEGTSRNLILLNNR